MTKDELRKKYRYTHRVYRLNEKEVMIEGNTHDTIITYNTGEECLENFLRIKNEFKEAWQFYGDK